MPQRAWHQAEIRLLLELYAEYTRDNGHTQWVQIERIMTARDFPRTVSALRSQVKRLRQAQLNGPPAYSATGNVQLCLVCGQPRAGHVCGGVNPALLAQLVRTPVVGGSYAAAATVPVAAAPVAAPVPALPPTALAPPLPASTPAASPPDLVCHEVLDARIVAPEYDSEYEEDVDMEEEEPLQEKEAEAGAKATRVISLAQLSGEVLPGLSPPMTLSLSDIQVLASRPIRPLFIPPVHAGGGGGGGGSGGGGGGSLLERIHREVAESAHIGSAFTPVRPRDLAPKGPPIGPG